MRLSVALRAYTRPAIAAVGSAVLVFAAACADSPAEPPDRRAAPSAEVTNALGSRPAEPPDARGPRPAEPPDTYAPRTAEPPDARRSAEPPDRPSSNVIIYSDIGLPKLGVAFTKMNNYQLFGIGGTVAVTGPGGYRATIVSGGGYITLPNVGKYALCETKAPTGYALAKPLCTSVDAQFGVHHIVTFAHEPLMTIPSAPGF